MNNMNANEVSKVDYESLNFESLKYSLLDDSDDILWSRTKLF